MTVAEMTHDDIADWCAERLKRMGYKFTFSNLTSASHGEQPDVLGLNSWGESIVVEVKVSRSDFLADKKKPWRANPGLGMGDFRVYLAPEGLLTVDDIPHGWQLWELYGKKRPMLRIVKGQAKEKRKCRFSGLDNMELVFRNTDAKEYRHFNNRDKNYQSELTWILKFMGRAIDDGLNLNQYANNYQTN